VLAAIAVRHAVDGPPAAFIQPARLVGVAVLGVLLVLLVVVASFPPPQAAKVHINSVDRIRRKELMGLLISDFIKV
jgi:hypothetical protein